MNEDNKKEDALRCPNCFCGHHRTTNTWQRKVKIRGKVHTTIRRRRECVHCGTAFFTNELLENALKEDGAELLPKETKEETPPLPPEGKNPYLP